MEDVVVELKMHRSMLSYLSPGNCGPSGSTNPAMGHFNKREHMRCVHGKRKSRCADCGGGSFCVHGKRKSRCADCGCGEICRHGKLKSRCADCGGKKFKNSEECVCVYYCST
jgi:hypothetical protein